MSDEKKQKGNWRLVLVGVVLGSVITVGAVGIYPSVVNRAKNINWADGNGWRESTTREETRQKKEKAGSFTESRKDQAEKTLGDWLELADRLAVPMLVTVIFYLGQQFQKREREKANEQDKRERELAKDNLS